MPGYQLGGAYGGRFDSVAVFVRPRNGMRLDNVVEKVQGAEVLMTMLLVFC